MFENILFYTTRATINTPTKTTRHKYGLWRRAGEMRSVSILRNARANRAQNEAVEMGNKLTDFFSGTGAVSWQNDVV